MEKLVRNEVKGMKRYIAGKPISEVKRELGLDEVIKMASNENPFGTSEKVKQVLRETVDSTFLYPDSGNYDLRAELSRMTGRDMDSIFIGGGSDSLIKVISSTVLQPGDEIVMGVHSFSRYEDNAQLMGAVTVKSPMPDYVLDTRDMVSRITDRTRILYICTPNNPTGSSLGKAEIEWVLENTPQTCLVILDEAYTEFVTREDSFEGLDYLDRYKNLIILRTFSKAYGMAGLRVGYGFADKTLVEYFNRVVNPFDVNLFAQIAAVTALNDSAFLDMVTTENAKGKNFFYSEFEKMGLPYVVTDANFILVNLLEDDMRVFQELMKAGYIVRPGAFLGIPGFLRISISTMENNIAFMEKLKVILGK
ncbi:MAG TPA: histidinol-phosphate transaminase [Clostridiaceae bacterium]|nr:histidinol-phosphate transaminase [Clostridiaceae bacterium]